MTDTQQDTTSMIVLMFGIVLLLVTGLASTVLDPSPAGIAVTTGFAVFFIAYGFLTGRTSPQR